MMDTKTALAFRKKALSPFFKLFLLKNLPLAFIAGVRMKKLDDTGSETQLKFRWVNQNPFKSMYFAAMHMAAEFATGALLFQYLDMDFRFSMLLVNTQASFHKKAVGIIRFQCDMGANTTSFLKKISTQEDGDIIILKVRAINEQNDLVAEFAYHWSCKMKKQKK